MYYIDTSTKRALLKGGVTVSVGMRLKALRGGKSQKKVAHDLEITKSALSMYERDQRIPRDEIKIRIARYYNVSVESIFYVQ